MKLIDGIPAKRLAGLAGARPVSKRAKTNSRAPTTKRPGLKRPEGIPKTFWKLLDFETKEKLVNAAENETDEESESAAGGTGNEGTVVEESDGEGGLHDEVLEIDPQLMRYDNLNRIQKQKKFAASRKHQRDESDEDATPVKKKRQTNKDSDAEGAEDNLFKLVSAIIDKKTKKKQAKGQGKLNARPRGGHAAKNRRAREKKAAGASEESDMDSEIELSSDHDENGSLRAHVLAQSSQKLLSKEQRQYVRDINSRINAQIQTLTGVSPDKTKFPTPPNSLNPIEEGLLPVNYTAPVTVPVNSALIKQVARWCLDQLADDVDDDAIIAAAKIEKLTLSSLQQLAKRQFQLLVNNYKIINNPKRAIARKETLKEQRLIERQMQKFKDRVSQISTFDMMNDVEAEVCLHADWMSPEETASETDSVYLDYIKKQESAGVITMGKIYLVLVPIWASEAYLKMLHELSRLHHVSIAHKKSIANKPRNIRLRTSRISNRIPTCTPYRWMIDQEWLASLKKKKDPQSKKILNDWSKMKNPPGFGDHGPLLWESLEADPLVDDDAGNQGGDEGGEERFHEY